jgi:hypothetical protein
MSSISSAFDGAASVASRASNVILKYNPATLLYKGAKSAANSLADAFDDDKNNSNSASNSGASNSNGNAIEVEEDSENDDDVNSSKLNEETDNTDISTDWHWGIDYIFEVNRVTVHDLKVYAQDFINAVHSKDFKNNSIDISMLAMDRVDCTKPPKNSTKRRGLYLDVFVWRLINKLITKLVATNQLSLITTIGTGFASQTASTLSNAFQTINPLSYMGTSSSSSSASSPRLTKKHASFNESTGK